LLYIALAIGTASILSRSSKHWEKNGRKNRDDGYDDEELDQSKGSPVLPR
jgi:hypothetical protein